ncbi:PQQ-like domain-containing protein [Actinokineospora alba]|uniref:PQQ-like domain-containing protein n=1 Tax=Actinokineospora alba TaxID=504798 RepID=A0A1H0WJ36_9PSEU|nr:PQQ-binding-like beta-propeller repeat protein [Actinokineospora alba]TDP65379.1 putative pyrroloquinoline-quinone binding quinoprotein [Actinokineospora alba]SDH60874.1 PQQ-like domain-containing protein [Actinokineospora alba]SDP90618.1 PQQ-like domain-containing protein [Actinokineospora alba]
MTWQQQPPSYDPRAQFQPGGWSPPPPPRRRGKVWVVVAAIVAVVAAASVSVVLLTRKDEAPTATQPTEQSKPDFKPWTTKGEKDSKDNALRILNSDKDLIIVTARDVTAIGREDGEVKWFTKAPDIEAAEGAFCGAGNTPSSDNKLALTLGLVENKSKPISANCGIVTVIDLKTGELGWSTTVAYAQGAISEKTRGMPVEIVDDVVVATWDFNVFGLDLATGDSKWHVKLKSDPNGKPNCPVNGMLPAGPDSVVVKTTCIQPNGDALFSVAELTAKGTIGRSANITDADAGAPISSMKLLAGSPVVLNVTPKPGPDERMSIVTLDDDWKVQSVIHDERGDAKADYVLATVPIGFATTPVGAYQEQSRSLVSGNTMVSLTAPNKGKPNRIVATDLKTGKDLWATEEPALLFMQVLAIEGDKVYALQSALENTKDFDQSVVELDLKDGKVKDKKTTEVISPNDGPPTITFYGFTFKDGRAYGVHFQNSDTQWLAYSVG